MNEVPGDGGRRPGEGALRCSFTSLSEVIDQFLRRHDIADRRIIVAVSGGNDSTALLLALHQLPDVELSVLHVNHQLRGEESDGDERFVRELCDQLRLPVTVRLAPPDRELVRSRGLEAAAREQRLQAFAAEQQRLGFRWTATAHHQQDQAETLLMRLLHGAELHDLRGIRPLRQDGIIRPLLEVPRPAIAAWLAAHQVTPRQDSSNLDLRFTRNRVRAMVALMTGPEVEQLASAAARIGGLYEKLETLAGSTTIENAADEIRFSLTPQVAQALRLLAPEARSGRRSIERFLRSHAHRADLTGDVEILRGNGTLSLRRKSERTPPDQTSTNVEPGIPQRAGDYRVAIERVAHSNAPLTERLERGWRQRLQLAPGAEPAFAFRTRRPGDRFQPLGSVVQKKLKDFLIDRKIPRELRMRLPLLLHHDEIIWIPGVEVSENVRLSEAAGDIYEVTVEKD